MSLSLNAAILLVIVALSFFAGRTKALALANGRISTLDSLPGHYGFYTVVWSLLPSFLALALWAAFGTPLIDSTMLERLASDNPGLSKPELQLLLNDIRNFVAGDVVSELNEELQTLGRDYATMMRSGQWGVFAISFLLALGGAVLAFSQIKPGLKARDRVEAVARGFMLSCSVVAVLITVGIVFSLLFESMRFFTLIPASEFLLGVEWSPQIAIRADQVVSAGAFGAIPLFAGTLLITFIAMLVAVPIGLMSAIYLTQYADSRVRSAAKPLLEILAGVPTVVYGFFAVLALAPWLRTVGEGVGLDVASESALAAGLVMGIMIIPFMSSLTDDALTAVPQSMRDGSLALGATTAETVKHVLVPAALPGIVGSFLLSVSRAIGETMIVVMAAGLAANLTANPLEAVTTVTVQIVTLLTGDQEFDSAKTLAAFALGLVLFLVTLVLNVIAQQVVKAYREQYE